MRTVPKAQHVRCMAELTKEYGLPRAHAIRVLEIAQEHGLKVAHTGDMRSTVTVRYRGDSQTFTIAPGMPRLPKSSKKVPGKTSARRSRTGYTSMAHDDRSLAGWNSVIERSRASTYQEGQVSQMAKRAAAVAEPEPEETEKDYTVYADKPATPLMRDFAEWIKDEVGLEFSSKAAEAAFDNGVRLGGTLRMEFQRSDFCKTRREERKAASAASNGAAEPEEEEAPAPRRRTRAAAAKETVEAEPEAPASTRRPRATGKTATGRPARRGKVAAAADEPAPY